jgi:4-cresol dehydrogenase (hydroxylating)
MTDRHLSFFCQFLHDLLNKDYEVNLSAAIDEWSSLLGSDCIVKDESAAANYGFDTSATARQIPAALKIRDSSFLPDVMRIANQHLISVYPISTGKNWGYGSGLPARDGCVIIDLSPLQKVIHFDSELGVATLEPGVTQAMLSDFLIAGQHPFLVPVTGAGPSCSVVGNALERGFGVTPHVDHFGAVTDIEAVLPDGSLYRTALREAGGEELARLFKWGIGPYFTGLFTQGGFGIVTRMSIVLARRPECVKVCLFSLKDDALLEPAALRIRAIMSKLPGTVGAINLMNQHRVLSMAAPYPADQVAAGELIPHSVIESMGRHFQVFPWTGFGTLYGTTRMVAAAQKEIKAELGPIASRMMFLTPERAQLLKRLSHLLPGKFGKGLQGMTATLTKSLELVTGRPNETALPLAYWRNTKPRLGALRNPAKDGCGLIWYAPLVPMRPTDLRAFVNMVKEIAPRHGLEPLITFTTLSDRLFDSTVPLVFDREQPGAEAAAMACYDELLHTGRAHGWFPYRVGINAMPSLMALQSDAKAFQEQLRRNLDPNDLMAPGRYR